ncbi:MAG TPA: choice-of-anchor Q domain-containing protein, partial [Candidatus Saccharimonadales bacterium]|nr:choice-of-anchor Q domain-containing protein [Candidatus Saccharimonadales bacterium]
GANYGNANGRPASYVTFNGIDFNSFGNWSGDYLGCTTSGTDISGCQAGTFMTSVTIENANALSRTGNDIGIGSGQNITLKNINAGPNCCSSDAEIVVGATRYDNDSTGDHRTWFSNGITLDNVYLHDSYGGPDSGTAACSNIPSAEWPNCSTQAEPNNGNHPDCIQFVDAATNIMIKNSRFYNCPENNWGSVDLATGTQWFSNITLENNMFYGAKYYDMQFVGGVASSGGYPAFKGYLKLLYNSFSTVPEFAGFDASATVTATGNIFGGAAKCRTSNETPDYTTTVPINSTYNLWTSGTCGTGDIDGTPSYVSTVYPWDLHLKSGSAGIDQAESSSCAVSTDMDGDSRPQGTACDIGADETLPTANVWVSTTGDDATCARGDQTKPCASFSQAYQIAQAGDIIQIASGTYGVQDIPNRTDLSVGSAKVTFCVAPGGDVTLDSGNVASAGLSIESHDVEISGAYCGSSGRQTDHITVPASTAGVSVNMNLSAGDRNVTVDNVHTDAFFTNAWATTLQYSEVGPLPDAVCKGGGPNDLVDLWWIGADETNPGEDYKILNNYIHDGECISGAHVDGIQGEIGNTLIEGNRITGCSQLYFNGVSSANAGDSGYAGDIIRNNMFELKTTSPGGGIICSDFNAVSSGPPMDFEYNTVDGAVAFGNSSGMVGTNISRGNIYLSQNYCNSYESINSSLIPPTCAYNVFASAVDGSNSKACVPKLSSGLAWSHSDSLDADFHLSATDTCAAGAGDLVNYPATDFDGDSRSSPPWAGADEVSNTLNPGDLNSDGHVNITDLSIMLSNWGTTNSTCDLNSNGTVDIFDLSILLSHYGT